MKSVALLFLSVLLLSCSSYDPCSGVSEQCVALRLLGTIPAFDALTLEATPPGSAMPVDFMMKPLPLLVPVAFASAQSGSVSFRAVAAQAGKRVASGSTTATLPVEGVVELVMSADGAPPPPACQNGVRDGKETDIDCGGGECNLCGPNKRCRITSDCQSGSCVTVGQSTESICSVSSMALSAATPPSAPLLGGTLVKFDGTGLGEAVAVTIGDRPATELSTGTNAVTVRVPRGDLVGKVKVTVTLRSGPVLSNSSIFEYTVDPLSLADPVHLSAGSGDGISALLLARISAADGPDVVMGNSTAVRFFRFSGNAFQTNGVSEVSTGTKTPAALGTIERDPGGGRIQLVIVNKADQNIQLFQKDNYPSKTFTAVTPLALGGMDFPKQGLVVGDFSGDGLVDLITLVPKKGKEAFVLRGKTGDQWEAPADQDVFTGSGNSAVVLAPYAGRVAFAGEGEKVSIWKLKMDGSQESAVSVNQGASKDPTGLVVGDVDGTAGLDLVTINVEKIVTVLRNKDASSFYPPESFTAPCIPRDVALGDLDGRGRDDIVLTCDDRVVLYLSDQGLFTRRVEVQVPSAAKPGLVRVGDVNRDGKSDIIIGDQAQPSILYLLNTRP